VKGSVVDGPRLHYLVVASNEDLAEVCSFDSSPSHALSIFSGDHLAFR
jgi:hypothetical protein